MSARVTEIWRHPIKAHGREALDRVALTAGQCLPWDRAWAVAHDNSQADGSEWVRCGNFTRGVRAPQLMAITSELDEDTGRITLHHPRRPDLNFDPATEEAAFLDWVMTLMPQNRSLPARLVRARSRGMTDSSFPSVTLCNLASHRAVEERMGKPLSIHRWRGNIWFDGPDAWEEFDWIDREIRIGGARLRVSERTTRCLATAANPETGERDANTLGTLGTWGHTDFSVKAEVVSGGDIAIGDTLEVLE